MLTSTDVSALLDYANRDLPRDQRAIICRGGRTGSKLHLACPGSSVLNCGHWLKASASHFQLPVATALVWTDNSKGSVLCEKCFAAILSPDAPALDQSQPLRSFEQTVADAEAAKPRRAGRKLSTDTIGSLLISPAQLADMSDDDYAQLAAAIRTEGKRRRAATRRAR